MFLCDSNIFLKKLVVIFLCLYLCACATYTTSISPTYEGPLATLSDSFARQTSGRANFFYLKEIEGKAVENALTQSSTASYGQGNNLKTVGKTRQIEARELSLTLAAQVYNSAPIAAMFNSNNQYYLEGNVKFIPEPDSVYIVKGKISVSMDRGPRWQC